VNGFVYIFSLALLSEPGLLTLFVKIFYLYYTRKKNWAILSQVDTFNLETLAWRTTGRVSVGVKQKQIVFIFCQIRVPTI
jgi:hypothetical protein